MPDERKCLYLPEMTWPEVKAALPEVKMAIIPVGSNEQHGPHGTFQMDTAESREFAKRLGERLYPHALVAPAVPIGISGHHMHFPGTITLQAETLISLLMDMAKSLHAHGIRRFFFANGHGGNAPALTIVCNRIKHEMGCPAAWATLPYSAVGDITGKYVTSETSGHSCEGEISIMLYLWPDAVRTEALTAGEIVRSTRERAVQAPWASEAHFFDEITANGCLGDARKASAEIGRELVETGLDRAVSYLKAFMELCPVSTSSL